jgi:hypothetical protein
MFKSTSKGAKRQVDSVISLSLVPGPQLILLHTGLKRRLRKLETLPLGGVEWKGKHLARCACAMHWCVFSLDRKRWEDVVSEVDVKAMS